jgi:hypothetical protein
VCAIAEKLNALGIEAPRGGQWAHASAPHDGPPWPRRCPLMRSARLAVGAFVSSALDLAQMLTSPDFSNIAAMSS